LTLCSLTPDGKDYYGSPVADDGGFGYRAGQRITTSAADKRALVEFLKTQKRRVSAVGRVIIAFRHAE
jgi:hypothetical protein